jgi:hypothetical protein
LTIAFTEPCTQGRHGVLAQGWQMRLDIDALPVPVEQRPIGKAVPQIVNSRAAVVGGRA